MQHYEQADIWIKRDRNADPDVDNPLKSESILLL